ncbi:MAG: hemerythrin domain-containing protein [Ignavibacteriae bacterium]|nr:MAG: hemerythrin domain-containing protein [Ignavibacteriota bacterium]
MNIMEAANRNYFDAVSFLENKQEEIMDNLLKLERISWEIESMVINDAVLKELKDLNQALFNDLAKLFTAEEDVLFPELQHVLPEPSSTAVMKNEHDVILTLNNSILELLNHKNVEDVKDKIQSSMISLVDILQRHLHKKNEVLYYEVQSMIPRETLDEIYIKMLKRFDKP